MGGPNLEVFKFSLYLFFPLATIIHFGNPKWYQEHVVPYRMKLFPPVESTNQIPQTRTEVRAELEKMRAERAAKQQQRLDGESK